MEAGCEKKMMRAAGEERWGKGVGVKVERDTLQVNQLRGADRQKEDEK